MVTFDLEPYGLNVVLTPKYNFNMITRVSFAKGLHTTSNHKIDRFNLRGETYSVLETMGSGTYGTTYKVRSQKDKKEYAIKHIHDNLERVKDLIVFAKEAIIQILIAEESKTQENGPYAPILYEIAYDPYSLNGYIRSELMRNTCHNLITELSPAQNDIVIPDALTQMATMLQFLGKGLRFNHRDFKADNVMYVGSGNKRIYKLIDFGFSCLTWNGLKINGGDYFAASPTCFKKHRDLSQMIYYMLRYIPSISTSLRTQLTILLQANIGSKTCGLYKECEEVDAWVNTYDVLNRENVTVPHGNPKNVINAMNTFMHPLPPMPPLPPLPPLPPIEPPKICVPGKIINPKSGRCVKEHGPIGEKQLEKVAAPADCPPGKIRNPKTRRCVKLDGWAGKRAQQYLHISENAFEPLEIPKQDCSPGKIRNPKTRRCVKLDGWAGKRVQHEFPLLPLSKQSDPVSSEKGIFNKTRKFIKGFFS